MVWCNLNYATYKSPPMCVEKNCADQLPNDSEIRKTNIMINVAPKHYNEHDIYSLISAGVNIFNIDMIQNDKLFYESICATISRTEDMPFMYKFPYYRPVAVAITIDANSDLLFEYDKIDIIIVKNLTSREEVIKIRKIVITSGKQIPLLAWINGNNDIDKFEDIVEGSDGVLYNCSCSCEVFHTVKNYIMAMCKKKHKSIFNLYPTIISEFYEKPLNRQPGLAGPTRAVTCTVDGIAVSDDVTVQEVPSEAVRFLDKICRAAESGLDSEALYYELSWSLKVPLLPPLGVAMSACLGALRGEIGAVLVLTCSGQSARWIARARPPCPLIAVTAHRRAARQMHIYRGVLPLYYDKARAKNWNQEYWNRVEYGADFAMNIGIIKIGAKIAVLAPHEEGLGYCNSIQFIGIPVINPKTDLPNDYMSD